MDGWSNGEIQEVFRNPAGPAKLEVPNYMKSSEVKSASVYKAQLTGWTPKLTINLLAPPLFNKR